MPDAAPVLTLADLERWSFTGTALAVLGQPIKHSISPAMHNAALAALSQKYPEYADWQYFRFEVSPADLPIALKAFHRQKFRGINLTVPHKVLAVDELAAIDPAAREAGAVNTLVWTPAGGQGHNTDGYGLATAIREDLKQQIAGSDIILLGAGGAARGAAVECLRSGCASLTIANRSTDNLTGLLSLLKPVAGAIPLQGIVLSSIERPKWPANALVINATSAGLRTHDAPPMQLNELAEPRGVYDMIYNPPQTQLLAEAHAAKIPCANGLSMLVHQGAKALSIWTQQRVPVEVMHHAARTALQR